MDDDTAATVAAAPYDDEADVFDDGYDDAQQQEQQEQQEQEQEQEDPYEYEGYAWDEVTGQYYATADAGDAAFDGVATYYEDGGEEEPSPLTVDTYDDKEDAEAGGSLIAPTDSVETPEVVGLAAAIITSKDSATLAKAPPLSPDKKSKEKKTKTKSERVQKRQEMLEREEDAKQQQQLSVDGAGAVAKAGGGGSKTSASPNASRLAQPKPTFIAREKAHIRLQIRKARAIARKRMPVQVRILTQTRQHLSPLEKYFGSRSVDAALSDVFWASLKGDIRRVRHLVEIEHVSVVDSTLDPWNMQQTPLHWAAKGGSREVVEYLIGAGASVRCLDENGSFPLHLACWAGHIDAALALMKAGDSRDLYVRDFDAALAPLDWANIRGHAQLLKAIGKFEDSQWLPKFVDDLIRGVIRYKIKLFKPPPKSAKLATAANAETAKAGNAQSSDAQATADPPATAAAPTTATLSPAPEPTHAPPSPAAT